QSLVICTLGSDAGADGFGETINIKSFDTETFLNLAAHTLRPGFGTEETYTHLHAAAQIDAFLGSRLGNDQRIGWRTGNNGGSQIFHQKQLPARQTTTHGDNGGTNDLCTDMCPQSTREQPIAIKVLENILSGDATGCKGT